MTDWHTRIDNDWGDERTIIDPRSLDNGKPHGMEPRVPPHPPSTAGRFKQLPGPRLPTLSLSRHKMILGFAGLGVALMLASGLAVHEHRKATALLEALRLAEIVRVDAESDVVDSIPIELSRTASHDLQRAALVTAGDRARAERQATDSIVAHDYDAALRKLEVLENAFPEHRVYSDLVEVLRSKRHCVDRGPVGGRRCD